MGNLLKDAFKNSSFLHQGSDGSWGTDPHDADIIKAIAEVIKSIGELIIGSKKK